MHPAANNPFQGLIDHAMPADAANPPELLGYYQHPIMTFTGTRRASMTSVQLAFVDHIEPSGLELEHQQFTNTRVRGHGEPFNVDACIKATKCQFGACQDLVKPLSGYDTAS